MSSGQPLFSYAEVMDIKNIGGMKSRLPAVLLVDFDGTVVETEMMIFKATNMMLGEMFAFQLILSEYSTCFYLVIQKLDSRNASIKKPAGQKRISRCRSVLHTKKLKKIKMLALTR